MVGQDRPGISSRRGGWNPPRTAHILLARSPKSRMSRSIAARALAAIGFLIAAWCTPTAARATIVRFQTSSGTFDVRLYDKAAPNSVANFLNYVTNGRYTNTFIHRVPQLPTGGTANFVVQGGGFLLNNSIFAATGITTNAPIADEFGISNTRGTLAFAKNSLGATSQWFFNIGDNSSLDAQNFTVFGRVLASGMTVVDAINNLPVINASVAENAPGEDFDEIPVRDLQKVLDQQDITSNEAVMVNSISVLNLPMGDYDRNGVVNDADFSVWRLTLGSTVFPAADGNGNGVVDAADYVIWRNTLGQTSGGSAIVVWQAPEPASVMLLIGAAPLVYLGRYRRKK